MDRCLPHGETGASKMGWRERWAKLEEVTSRSMGWRGGMQAGIGSTGGTRKLPGWAVDLGSGLQEVVIGLAQPGAGEASRLSQPGAVLKTNAGIHKIRLTIL